MTTTKFKSNNNNNNNNIDDDWAAFCNDNYDNKEHLQMMDDVKTQTE